MSVYPHVVATGVTIHEKWQLSIEIKLKSTNFEGYKNIFHIHEPGKHLDYPDDPDDQQANLGRRNDEQTFTCQLVEHLKFLD